MAFDFNSFIGGNLGQLFKDIVGTFKADPNKVLEMQQMIDQNRAIIEQKQADLQSKLVDADVSLNQIAGENIRAEITSPDPYVRRARATPVWMICLCVFIDYGVIGIAHIFKPSVTPIELPQWFWYFATLIIGGYVGSRIADRALGGAGGSASFLGIKLDSKGDGK